MASLKFPLKDYSSGARKVFADDVPLISKFDDTGTFVYIGYAEPGDLTSAAIWRIKRITNATGDRVWADGNTNYDNIWDNRAALSYS